MNNCPNCGSPRNQGDVFCKVCGTKLPSSQNIETNPQQYQQITNQNINLTDYQKSNDLQTNSNLNFQQNQNNTYSINNEIDDEYLIDSYIGKNTDKLKKGNFSFNTLFFWLFICII